MLELEPLSITSLHGDVIRSSLDSCKLKHHGRSTKIERMTDQRQIEGTKALRF